MEIIFGIEGKWIYDKEQHCERCALYEICNAILRTDAEVPYICEDKDTFTNKYFLSLNSFIRSLEYCIENQVVKYRLRRGQATFNAVESDYGKIARFVQFVKGVDCFYDNKQIDAFLEACYKYLDSEEFKQWDK